MSTDVDTSVIVGFVIPEENFFKSLKTRQEEVSHFETRFDSKTGKKFKKKIIDEEARWVHKFNGKIYEENEHTWELLEAIGKRFKCFASLHGNLNWNENVVVAIESKRQKKTQNGGYSFKNMGKLPIDDLNRIAREMKKAGFELGDPGIYAVIDIS